MLCSLAFIFCVRDGLNVTVVYFCYVMYIVSRNLAVFLNVDRFLLVPDLSVVSVTFRLY